MIRTVRMVGWLITNLLFRRKTTRSLQLYSLIQLMFEPAHIIISIRQCTSLLATAGTTTNHRPDHTAFRLIRLHLIITTLCVTSCISSSIRIYATDKKLFEMRLGRSSTLRRTKQMATTPQRHKTEPTARMCTDSTFVIIAKTPQRPVGTFARARRSCDATFRCIVRWSRNETASTSSDRTRGERTCGVRQKSNTLSAQSPLDLTCRRRDAKQTAAGK